MDTIYLCRVGAVKDTVSYNPGWITQAQLNNLMKLRPQDGQDFHRVPFDSNTLEAFTVRVAELGLFSVWGDGVRRPVFYSIRVRLNSGISINYTFADGWRSSLTSYHYGSSHSVIEPPRAGVF